MRKKAFVLIIAMLLVFGLAACVDNTTTTTTTTTTTASQTTTSTTSTGTTTTTSNGTTTTTTALTITYTGLGDAGLLPEDKIFTNTWFDLLAGVQAMGSNGTDYTSSITTSAFDAACQVEDNKLMSTEPKTCIIQYEVKVGTRFVRQNRTVKISTAPIQMEFTEVPDAIDNEALFGTDYIVTVDDPGLNSWHFWQEAPAILGTTGSVKVENDKLIIVQEKVGGNKHSLQVIALTETALVKNQFYKITMTITSTTDRYIDIVTKAPNNEYALDTHSNIEIKTGTFEYEMVFKANQAVLHLNIMTGNVEGTTDAQAGTLEFSNLTLWQGPIVRDYEALVDFFKNDDIAVGAEMDYITGTDTDYVREFYYWDQADGNILAGEKTEAGFEVTVLQNPANDYGAQLQWNDINKVGTPLIKDGYYKLTMNINASVTRTIAIEVTGSSNSLPVSKRQVYELNVGDNAIVLEFQSKYEYFFMKMHFGNLGDAVNTGTFILSDLELAVEKGTVPVDPEEPTPVVGNLASFSNAKNSTMFFEGIDLPAEVPANTVWLWKGIEAWFAGWTSFPVVTGTINSANQIVVDIDHVGPEFYAIQMKYRGGELVIGGEYVFSFHVYSDVARKINVQIKDGAFGSAYVDQEIELAVGLNVVEIPFTAAAATFNYQFNLGEFVEGAVETGVLTFDNLVATRVTEAVEGYIQNGDFATAMPTLGATDAPGWALWTTAGIPDGWALPNYGGTIAIADGTLNVSTTAKGGADWGAQIQYNAPTDDLIVGALYRIEADITSNVQTTIALQFKGTTDNGPHSTVNVTLNAGLNHVVVYLTAMQAKMRLFLLVGFTEPGTELTFDNFTFEKPITVLPPVDPNAPVGNLSPVSNPKDTAMYYEGIDLPAEVPANTVWLWKGIPAWFGGWASFPEVTGNVNAAKQLVVDINHVGPEFWAIQLKYRGGELVVDGEYVFAFHVYSDVARKIGVQLKNAAFGGTYIDLEFNLVVGLNVIEIPFTAAAPSFNFQINLGMFNAEADETGVLIFDNFMTTRATEVATGLIDNADFSVAMPTLGATDAPGWALWTTAGIPDGWALPNYGGTIAIANGTLNVSTTAKGGADWGAQVQYNAPTDDLIVGAVYRVEVEITSNVQTTIALQFKGTTDNGPHSTVNVTLSAGLNHVVVYLTAMQPKMRLFLLVGLTEPGTELAFDNFVIQKPITIE